MKYDKIRNNKINEFKDKHKESNGIITFLSKENKEKLEDLKFKMSDVWVLTDAEYDKLKEASGITTPDVPQR